MPTETSKPRIRRSYPEGSGRLERLLDAGTFAVTAEVTPPLSSDPGRLLDSALPLKDLADAINITDGVRARAHMASVAAAAALVSAGIEPVLQLITRDRNRIALQGLLLGAAALGIRNVLCLTGDPPAAGDQPEAKPVFDLTSPELIATAAAMRDDGTIPSGREIAVPPRLFIGATDTPIDPPPGWRPDRLEAKLDAGADFVQTQLCFDAGVARRYAARLEELGLGARVPMLIGLGPLGSAGAPRWMRENLPGAVVPDAVVRRMEGARDARREGRHICVELIQELREVPGIAGVHLMAPRNEAEIPRTIVDSGVLSERTPETAAGT